MRAKALLCLLFVIPIGIVAAAATKMAASGAKDVQPCRLKPREPEKTKDIRPQTVYLRGYELDFYAYSKTRDGSSVMNFPKQIEALMIDGGGKQCSVTLKQDMVDPCPPKGCDGVGRREIPLYTFVGGENLCQGQAITGPPQCDNDKGKDYDGHAVLIPSRKWDREWIKVREDEFTLSCLTGAIGKCVHWGYVPGNGCTSPKAADLTQYNQACVYAARADYAGGGHDTRDANTCSGVLVDITDDLNIQEKADPPHMCAGSEPMRFEAAWDENGSVGQKFRPRFEGCASAFSKDDQTRHGKPDDDFCDAEPPPGTKGKVATYSCKMFFDRPEKCCPTEECCPDDRKGHPYKEKECKK